MKQYMPNKLMKFEYKIWTTIDFKSKYLYNFQMYISVDLKKKLHGTNGDEAKTNYKVAMHLMQKLHGIGHVVVMDNFFFISSLVD